MGSDSTLQTHKLYTGRFNPRSHMGSDYFIIQSLKKVLRFQSTLPHGERPGTERTRAARLCFNPRSHMGSDCCTILQYYQSQRFQSTLPHGERPLATDEALASGGVSIHAPTWGATPQRPRKKPPRRVSIHAPTWGATNYQVTDYLVIMSFNPRSHMGSDRL